MLLSDVIVEGRIRKLELLVDALWKACDELKVPIGNSDCSCCEDYVTINLPCRDSIAVPEGRKGYWGGTCVQVVPKTIGGKPIINAEDYPTWKCMHGVVHGRDGPFFVHPAGRCDGCCLRDDYPGRKPPFEDTRDK